MRRVCELAHIKKKPSPQWNIPSGALRTGNALLTLIVIVIPIVERDPYRFREEIPLFHYSISIPIPYRVSYGVCLSGGVSRGLWCVCMQNPKHWENWNLNASRFVPTGCA
jgi:hypothetical protein